MAGRFTNLSYPLARSGGTLAGEFSLRIWMVYGRRTALRPPTRPV